jgi:hypothetical protein
MTAEWHQSHIVALLEVKHFFSGAALYVNGAICASCSPAGLAFKLPELYVASLISTGRAKPLKILADRLNLHAVNCNISKKFCK